ncbi:hypothetical protein OH76DRAFT_939702 [Lentinus brumalis]|uniref:Uncharacterized protein n=1 Tax=Lentinus brumalis TaxID=2498619 RepID=A0A371CZD8_9APHY|nr:hypothetical protein OH76DRAFT_939702 [Polyporus brumalis]
MYIPVLSSYASSSGEVLDSLLRKRSPVPEPKGGGGHGGGGHASPGHSLESGSESSSGSHGSSGSSRSSGSSSASFGSRGSMMGPVTGSASSKSSATLYGSGDSKVSTIPQDQQQLHQPAQRELVQDPGSVHRHREGPSCRAGRPVLPCKQRGVDTAALVEDANAKPVPLPTGIDTALLNCLNSTIGQSVPLFDAAFSISAPGIVSLMAVPYAIWCLMDLF